MLKELVTPNLLNESDEGRLTIGKDKLIYMPDANAEMEELVDAYPEYNFSYMEEPFKSGFTIFWRKRHGRRDHETSDI